MVTVDTISAFIWPQLCWLRMIQLKNLQLSIKIRMILIIGVGVGKFGGCKGNYPEFSQTCPKSFCATLPANFLPQRSWRPFHGRTSTTKAIICFSTNVGAILWKQTTLGAIFGRIFSDFAQVFRDLPGFLTNQNFWRCACTPCTPRLLHYWYWSTRIILMLREM